MQSVINAAKVAIWAAILLSGCKEPPDHSGPVYSALRADEDISVYRLAVHPLHNPAKLVQAYQPLIDYLNGTIPQSQFVLEASRDYGAYEAKFKRGHLQFLLPNPWQTLEAMALGYRVIAMAGEAKDFKGIFIVRKDSSIQTPLELKGQAVSYPAPTALAACMMPQYFLFSHGLDITKDINNLYVGSQESAIMNAYMGQSAAGATWPPPWRAFQKEWPREAKELRVVWETPPLINNSVMAYKDIPTDIVEQVRQALLDLHKTDRGVHILKGMETSRFFPATDRDYEVVGRFIETFEKNVRPIIHE